jgi:hypothetical protein
MTPKLSKVLNQDRKRLYITAEQWHTIKRLAHQCSVQECRDVSIIEMVDRLIETYGRR